MKILIVLGLFFSIFFANEEKVNIGILYSKIFISEKDISTRSKIWLKYLNEEKLFENTNVFFYENEKQLTDDFLKNKIDILVSNPSYYFEEKDRVKNEVKNVWISSLSQNIYEEFYLIKNINSDITINNFKKAHLYFRDAIAKDWMEWFVLKNYKKKLENQFGKVESVDNHSKLIYRVFLNKNDLVVIPKDAYESLIKLNPQIEKQTVILKKSEPIFFSSIGLTNKNISDSKQLIIDNILSKNPAENDIDSLEFLNLSKVYIKRNSDLTKIENFYMEFSNLKKEFK